MFQKSLILWVGLGLMLGGQARAAEIIWLDPIPMDVPVVDGEVLEAINLAGPAVPDVGGVDFLAGNGAAAAPQYSNIFDILTSVWGGPTGAADLVDDPGLKTVVTTGRWIAAGAGSTHDIQLINLTPGTTYAIQLYTGDQRSCCSARGYHFEDGTGGVSPIQTRGGGMALIGQFTADGTTQTMTMVVEPGSSDPHLTGYVLSLATPPTIASNPDPALDATDVLRDADLSWSASKYAGAHNVYIGTSADDVDSATVPTAAGLSDTSYDPGRFDFGQTYFWRVDEVNATPDKTVFKGDLWNFTAEPYSIMVPVDVNNATASSSSGLNTPAMTVNGAGLTGNSHSTNSEEMWLSAPADLAPWLMYEFDGIEKLDKMLIWNSNSTSEGFVGWGIKEVSIETSMDGVDWTVLAEPNQLDRAPGAPTYNTPQTVDFGLVLAKYVRLNIKSNWGGLLPQYGLSEIQFYGLPVKAREPMPASGATEIRPDAVVAWRAGREADQHTVYVSDDVNAVADGTAPSLSSSTNSASLKPLDLLMSGTYYWRVDEVNDAEAPSTWAGPVWRLNTADALIVDDFESYGNKSPNRPFQTWLDGYGFSADEYFSEYAGNGTGAGIGHDIWSPSSPYFDGEIMETANTIPGSAQAMPFYYNNAGGVASQTERPFSEPQDWTVGGAKVLTINFAGQGGNTGTLFAMINNTKVVYDGGNSQFAGIGRGLWQTWNIDLTSMSGLQNVTKLTIGVDGSGASGMILIDDILLVTEAVETMISDDVTTPGDEVRGVPDDGDWPAAEYPALAIDNDVNTKFLHRKGGAIPTGFQVTPMVGATVVTGITLTTANDVPDRDPITFELSGSNTSIDGPYEVIASGNIVDFAGATEWPRFTQNTTPITFNNTKSYTHYQLLFPTLRSDVETTLMQIAEVELIRAQ